MARLGSSKLQYGFLFGGNNQSIMVIDTKHTHWHSWVRHNCLDTNIHMHNVYQYSIRKYMTVGKVVATNESAHSNSTDSAEMLRTSGSLYIQNPKSLITITFDPQEFVTIRVCNSKLIYACVLSVASFPGSPLVRWRHFIIVVWGETLGTRLHSANMLDGSLSNIKPLSVTRTTCTRA